MPSRARSSIGATTRRRPPSQDSIVDALTHRDQHLAPVLGAGGDPTVLIQAAVRRWLCYRNHKRRQSFMAKLGEAVPHSQVHMSGPHARHLRGAQATRRESRRA